MQLSRLCKPEKARQYPQLPLCIPPLAKFDTNCHFLWKRYYTAAAHSVHEQDGSAGFGCLPPTLWDCWIGDDVGHNQQEHGFEENAPRSLKQNRSLFIWWDSWGLRFRNGWISAARLSRMCFDLNAGWDLWKVFHLKIALLPFCFSFLSYLGCVLSFAN